MASTGRSLRSNQSSTACDSATTEPGVVRRSKRQKGDAHRIPASAEEDIHSLVIGASSLLHMESGGGYSKI